MASCRARSPARQGSTASEIEWESTGHLLFLDGPRGSEREFDLPSACLERWRIAPEGGAALQFGRTRPPEPVVRLLEAKEIILASPGLRTALLERLPDVAALVAKEASGSLGPGELRKLRWARGERLLDAAVQVAIWRVTSAAAGDEIGDDLAAEALRANPAAAGEADPDAAWREKQVRELADLLGAAMGFRRPGDL